MRVRSCGQTARFTHGDWLQRPPDGGDATVTLVEERLLQDAAAAVEAKAVAVSESPLQQDTITTRAAGDPEPPVVSLGV